MARPKVYDEHLAHRLISDAAATLAAGGVEALSLRPLAAGAGTSTSAIYAMFGDKAGLVSAVVNQARAGFLQAQRECPTTDDPLADLTALGHAYRQWALAHPSLYAVMFGGRALAEGSEPAVPIEPTEPTEPVEPVEPVADDALSAAGQAAADLMGDETISVLAGLVQALVDAGLLRGDVVTITLSIWAGVHGLVSLEITGAWPVRGAAARALYEQHLAAIRRAWQPQAASGSASA